MVALRFECQLSLATRRCAQRWREIVAVLPGVGVSGAGANADAARNRQQNQYYREQQIRMNVEKSFLYDHIGSRRKNAGIFLVMGPVGIGVDQVKIDRMRVFVTAGFGRVQMMEMIVRRHQCGKQYRSDQQHIDRSAVL